jgi:hypothetical protein
MRWIKQGLIFEPPTNLGWMVAYAILPVADWLGDDMYRVYFTGRDQSNRSQIGFFEFNITQPYQILNISKHPILMYGELGCFDENGAISSWIVNHQRKKYLYYVGWNVGSSVPFRNAIGLAVGEDDGRTFHKHSKGPILDRGIYDPCFTASSCVLVEENIWKMWYLSCVKWEIEDGKPKHYYHIKYAESDNGIEWTRNGIVCIDFKTVDEYAISRPCVLKEGGIYKMWYSYRGASYRIGYAESHDGVYWERKDEQAGIDVSNSGWDSEMIEYPFVFDHGGQRYMLYNGNGYGKTGIGLALLSSG